MNYSDDDAGLNPRQKPIPASQNVNLTVQPIQVNVTQTTDAQVLKKLDEILAALTLDATERAKLQQITNDLKTHTQTLKQAVDDASIAGDVRRKT